MNNKELNNVYKKINSWYNKKTRVLSIKTRPFNTNIIFSNIINRVLKEKGNILYVLCESKVNILNKKQQEYKNSFNYDNEEYNLKDITIVEIDKVTEINNEYDLVIFDDVTVFSNVTSDRIRESVEDLYWKSRKIIIYSCEKVFPIGEKFDLVYLKSNNPMIEPRFISTRLKLEEEIPLTLFDYFKWFNENKRTTLIFTPSEEKLNKVYSHYYNLLKREKMRVVKYIENQSFSFINEILDGYTDSLFIVTNNISEYINNIQNVNIVVLFADDSKFTYKKLVYLCAAVSKDISVLPEVIFVSKEVSDDMDRAKSLARGFNQKLWEKKLLKV